MNTPQLLDATEKQRLQTLEQAKKDIAMQQAAAANQQRTVGYIFHEGNKQINDATKKVANFFY